MVTLYRKNKLGIGSWRIWREDAHAISMAHATTLGGQEVIHTEFIDEGKAGRTLDEQVMSRINSRVNRQKDRGYVDSLETAQSGPLTNTLNLPPPMLAKKLDDLRSWPGKSVVQPKLDGFRCMVTRSATGEIMCYSRQGKELDALEHIREAIDAFLPEGIILDGEVYLHGVPLQGIASLAKRQQLGTERLVYNVYDSISDDSFPYRYAEAKEVVGRANSPIVIMVKNEVVKDRDEVWNLFEQYRNAGYEGAMLRILESPYEAGRRSHSLLKVKARYDTECEVLDVIPGSDGLGILICQLPNGKIFKTLAPGNHDQKRFVIAHKDQYIGRQITVEYANLTNDGIPFHAVATRWRPLEDI
jgi:DNA ligase 1